MVRSHPATSILVDDIARSTDGSPENCKDRAKCHRYTIDAPMACCVQ
jgi:hypothetical protein